MLNLLIIYALRLSNFIESPQKFFPSERIFVVKNMHDFHTSITEVTYNSSEKAFEVSIRLFSDDLEKVLLKENPGIKFIGMASDKKDVLLNKYIQKHFGLLNTQAKRKTMNYIGHEIETDAHWLYIEIPFNEKLQGYSFQNDVFFETFPDQTNIINLTYTSLKKSFLFKDKKSVVAVD